MRQVIVSLFALALGLVSEATWPADQVIELQVGETHVLSHPGVKRVAIGNSQVIGAIEAEGREVVVFARAEGVSSMHVWTNRGLAKAYELRVVPAGAPRLRAEVEALLARIPGARSTEVGGRILIEGNDLSDDDRLRIAALADRYPTVLDFTGQVGWDHMVQLDVQVVEIPTSRLRELGVNWGTTTQGGINAGLAWDAGSLGRMRRPGEEVIETLGSASAAAGYFGVNALLSSRIALLAQSGEAVMLAQPQLLARSGASATFLAGGEVPYSSTDARGNATTLFKPYGVMLKITPRIDRSGVIRSLIEVEASSVDTALSVPGGPALRTRRASTEFNVRSGDTLVIGGFLSRERDEGTSGLPWLQDMPILGALFSSRRYQLRETELAIFVTPKVIAQAEPAMAERVQRGREVLEAAFPLPPRLGTAVPTAGGWNTHSGAGSQWSARRNDVPHSLTETRP
ncbi:type II and III secretion system protein family protein [Achromobacter insolitus]|uniref:type II and III secretion system protein family protein n=1 Tax=Achromobacter insolitus TaxID=217204 RepID=UPI0007C35B15|nr:pilus assembly protein N-terminal domain-containing protein [Achromobacter insolitus]AXA69209.1 secretion protein [Achromobacter insolitus]MCP1404307.1 pilus assembly protein CpaC [Achromobacter insolitus]OAD17171.1 secretion protein [Achromobacter insolitus]QEK93976.1 secretion protein [Achromobacter insolitus]CAB3958883.1 Type 3 secretion system secretin [Achromobacter insolitus]